MAIAGTAKNSLIADYGISGNKNKSISDEPDAAKEGGADEPDEVSVGKKKETELDQLDQNQNDSQNDNKVNSSSNGLSEEVSSSGRGSSNLDNSPKFSKPPSSTVVKSNSSSSGFASRTFSITGSPDKCATPQAYHSDQFDKLSDKSGQLVKPAKRVMPNEASEADENYEFDQLTSPNDLEVRVKGSDQGQLTNMLYKRNYSQPNLQWLRNLQLANSSLSGANSLSACTTPTSQPARGVLYNESTEEDLTMRAAKQRRIQQLKQQQLKQQRIEQQSLMSDEQFDDYCYDLEGSRIDAAADEEIRQHLDHLSRKQQEFNSLREPAMLPNRHLNMHPVNYPNLAYPLNSPPNSLAGNYTGHLANLPTVERNAAFGQQQRLNLLEQHSARSFGSAPIRLTDRAVFSDSELYDHQMSNDGRTNFGQITNATSAYQMSRYLRRMRCEQLKEEFRRKYGERFKASNLETAC